MSVTVVYRPTQPQTQRVKGETASINEEAASDDDEVRDNDEQLQNDHVVASWNSSLIIFINHYITPRGTHLSLITKWFYHVDNSKNQVWGSPWTWVWDGYEDRNCVPMAALLKVHVNVRLTAVVDIRLRPPEVRCSPWWVSLSIDRAVKSMLPLLSHFEYTPLYRVRLFLAVIRIYNVFRKTGST